MEDAETKTSGGPHAPGSPGCQVASIVHQQLFINTASPGLGNWEDAKQTPDSVALVAIE